MATNGEILHARSFGSPRKHELESLPRFDQSRYPPQPPRKLLKKKPRPRTEVSGMEAQPSAETAAFNQNVSRQRLDHFELPNGRVRAVLTITVGDREFVYTEDSSAAEAAETARIEGDFDDLAIEGLFGSLGKALGKVAKGAVKAVKSVASSKVFKAAAKGLAMVAPALGPLAPAALAASGAMSVTSSLVGARAAASRGNKKAAAVLTAEAVKLAKKHAPKQAATLLKIAADKSRGADKLASTIKTPKKAGAKALPSKRQPLVFKNEGPPIGRRNQAPTAEQLAAYRRAGLGIYPDPSSKPAGGPITAAELLAAARAGRVYVVQAA